MNKAFISFLILLSGFQMNGQSFEQFINHLNALPETQRQAVADSFLNATHSFPYTENDTLVHFIYSAAAQSVAMAGDATGWNPDRNLTHVGGCNFWYYSTSYEADARLDYKLVINGANWILDPRNPFTCAGGYGPNSELRMPEYTVPPEISYYANLPHGAIKDTTFQSSHLGNSRQVRVYLPPGYPEGSVSYPVVLFHDGLEYLSLCNGNNILDYLIANHLILPLIGVFVPPVDRTEEYAGSKIDNFTDFIIEELMPVIDSKYRTNADPSKRAMVGASNGGNIALYIGMKHPEIFGKIAAQSSNILATISSTFATGPKLNLALYIDIGSYDIPVLIPMVNGFKDILQAKDYTFQYREWHEGHSWGNWKGHLKLPLMQFFPWSSGLNDQSPDPRIKLEQNRPNPFHGHTVIPFSAPVNSEIELTLVDLMGKNVETLFSGSVSVSENTLEYYHKKPAGQYILTLKQGKTVKDSMIIQAL